MTPAAVLSVVVRANTAQANAGLAKTQAQLRSTAATAQASTAKIGTSASAMSVGIAKGAGRAAAAVGLIGAGAVVAAAKFEDSFADVRKTVDATEAEFQTLKKGIIEMSQVVPIAATDLAELAGEAGALGVKTDSLLKFTRVAADLGVATNLSAEDAANALARLGNIMEKDTAKAYERMGSTLVDLGNKGASTEAEITMMALRIAGAGKTLGLPTKDVLGLSAALANLGIRAEMGGSAISRVMLQMQDAVASGGPELQNFAKISGLSVEEFSKGFGEDAPAAIELFARGLDKVNQSGGSIMDTLKGVELNEIRVRDTLLRLGGATGEVTAAQKIANEAWAENNALAVEAEKKYATTASQFQLLKARILAVAVAFGDEMLPEVNKVMLALGKGDISGALEGIAKLGVKVAGELGKSLLGAWMDMNVLAKLFTAGVLIRVVGGRGAILAAGVGIGKLLGIGVATGAGGTAATGAAVGGLRGGLLRSIRGAGLLGVGVVAADVVMGEMGRRLDANSGDMWKELDAKAGIMNVLGQELDVSGEKSLLNIVTGFNPLAKASDEAARSLKDMLNSWAESGRQISPAMAQTAHGLLQQTELTAAAQAQVGDYINKWRKVPNEVGKAMDSTSQAVVEAAKATTDDPFQLGRLDQRIEGLDLGESIVKAMELSDGKVAKVKDDFKKLFKDLSPTARAAGIDAMEKLGKSLEERGVIPKGSMDKLLKRLERSVDDYQSSITSIMGSGGKKQEGVTKNTWSSINSLMGSSTESGQRHVDKMNKGVTGSTKNMSSAVKGAITDMGSFISDALEALGVDPVSFSAKKAGKKRSGASGQPGSSGTAARGGLFQYGAAGDMGRDSIATRIGGQDVRVAPGEVAGVFTRHQQQIANARFADMGGLPGFFKRHDKPHYMARGGLVPGYAVGGGVEEPPGDPGSEVVQSGYGSEVGKFLQTYGMDLTQGYNPSGPSVSAGHLQLGVPPSLDVIPLSGDWDGRFAQGLKWALSQGMQVGYDGQYGTQSWSGHGEGNHAHIDWAGGAGGALGNMIAQAAPKLPGYTLEGPPGALTSMGQAAMDQVQKAGQQYLDKHAGSSGAGSLADPGGPITALAKKWVAQMWSPGQWDPYWELKVRESGNTWDPTIMNAAGSGAGGIPQALPPEKMGSPAWPPTQGRETITAQIRWMLDYIKGRYGSPSGALSFHDANNYYAQGGLVPGLAKGGEAPFNIKQVIKRLNKGKNVAKLMDKLKDVGPSNITAQVESLSQDYSDYMGFADNASQFNIDNDDGTITGGMWGGNTEWGWLQDAWQSIWPVRELLVTLHGQVEEAKKNVQDAIDKARARIEHLKKEVIKDIEKDIEKFRDAIHAIQGQGDNANKQRKHLQEQVKELQKQKGDATSEITKIQDKVVQPLMTRQGDLGSDHTTIRDALESVQGRLPDKETAFGHIASMGTEEARGKFGGDLLTIANRLYELDHPTTAIAPGGLASERADILEGLLRESNQRVGAILAQRSVLDTFPYVGAFAKGGTIARKGFALVGENGPELAEFPISTKIRPEVDVTASTSGPSVEFIINGDIVQKPGDTRPPIEIRRRDRRRDTLDSLRGVGRNSTPGGKIK